MQKSNSSRPRQPNQARIFPPANNQVSQGAVPDLKKALKTAFINIDSIQQSRVSRNIE